MSDSPRDVTMAARLTAFVQVVRAALPEMIAPADLDGARRSTAAALLARAVDLLEDAFRCVDAGAEEALELVLRTGCEVTLRGRFLLSRTGPDKFLRMIAEFDDTAPKRAETAGVPFIGLPPFLVAPDGTPKRVRNLFDVATCEHRLKVGACTGRERERVVGS
jgi:hypothetical protein